MAAFLDPRLYGWLADLVVVVHLLIVLYVLVGEVLILAGWALRWGWVRNAWFRVSHLLVIVVVATEGAFGVLCPLTTWEYDLRRRAGQAFDEGSFVGRLAHDILFVDAPQATLNAIYIAFAGLVLLTLLGCRPRWRRRRETRAAAGQGA